MSELANTIKQICDEKGLSFDAVVGTIESALAAAYRKDFGLKNQNIKVKFDIETGQSEVFDVKTVVEDLPPEEELAENAEEIKDEAKKEETDQVETVGEEQALEKRKFNPKTEIQLSEAKLIKKTAQVGDEIKTKLEIPASYGRMAAQTAKQVIIQKLREAEREMIFNDFKDKEHEVVSGVVQRREGRIVLIDLGRVVGILPQEEQIYHEEYRPGARIKVYVKEVKMGSRGPEVILSRTSEEILKKIFYLEIPEISNGLVELKSVAREAGSRSKVAVVAVSESIDPIGSCVGQRGSRIQTIIAELGGEKVDIIQYDDDQEKFIANALSPAKIISIEIDKKEKKATVKVAEDQLSLSIGKGGQNVRLAARLTGWNIDIVGQAQVPTNAEETPKDAKEEEITDDSKQTIEVAEGEEEKKEDEVKDKKEKKEKKEGDKKTRKQKNKKTKEEGEK
jgi:N utilization substance protein A